MHAATWVIRESARSAPERVFRVEAVTFLVGELGRRCESGTSGPGGSLPTTTSGNSVLSGIAGSLAPRGVHFTCTKRRQRIATDELYRVFAFAIRAGHGSSRQGSSNDIREGRRIRQIMSLRLAQPQRPGPRIVSHLFVSTGQYVNS